MLSFSEISVNDKEMFSERILKYGAQASDICFTSIYMWAEALNFKFVEIGGLVCVISFTSTFKPYCLPPFGDMAGGDFEKAIVELKRFFDEKGWHLMFRRFVKKDVERLKEIKFLEYKAEYSRDASDYVYLREDLVKLSGKMYDGKRNHISRFKREHEGNYEYLDMKHEDIEECMALSKQYCTSGGKECVGCDTCEKVANWRVLKNFEKLGCKGGVVKLNGDIKAFTVGEMLNANTSVTHIEKADKDINGLYPFINQQFCTNGFPEAMYINREEDMGIEGLRRAKLSYHPTRMEDKYIIYF